MGRVEYYGELKPTHTLDAGLCKASEMGHGETYTGETGLTLWG